MFDNLFTKTNLHIEQGKGGKWRFYAYRDHDLCAQAPIAGFETREECEEAARAIIKGRLHISSVSFSPQNSEAW